MQVVARRPPEPQPDSARSLTLIETPSLHRKANMNIYAPNSARARAASFYSPRDCMQGAAKRPPEPQLDSACSRIQPKPRKATKIRYESISVHITTLLGRWGGHGVRPHTHLPDMAENSHTSIDRPRHNTDTQIHVVCTEEC